MALLKAIAYATTAYRESLELRNRVMRLPLGRDIFDEDLSFEKCAEMIGVYEEDVLLGVGVMVPQGEDFSLEFLCVDPVRQRGGLGGMLLAAMEERALELGAKRITMHARVSAQGFYERHGYRDTGEVCIHHGAPVPHIVMAKNIGTVD